MTWFVTCLRALGVQAKVWLVVDGAYAARPFLKPLLDLGIVVVSRLRRDACLYDLPGKSSGRGRPRIYGKNKISLTKRAAHKKGWQTISHPNDLGFRRQADAMAKIIEPLLVNEVERHVKQ